MTIKFILDNDTIYAVAQDEIYKGKHYTELMYAEIDRVGSGWSVRWEDSYNNPTNYATLLEAQTFVESTYYHHKPHLNSTGVPVEEIKRDEE